MKLPPRFSSLTKKQLSYAKENYKTELLSSIGKKIGLDERRVGELLKALGIIRNRWRYGRNRKSFEALYRVLINESKRASRTLPVDLTYEQFLNFTATNKCHYCGALLVWAERIRHKEYVGTNLDRKDNAKGYSVDNCVACCGECNRTKGDRYTYEEFMLLAPALRKIRKRRLNADLNAAAV